MQSTCTQCGLCKQVCDKVWKAITLTPEGPKIDLEQCSACGHCVAICPTGFIENEKSPTQREIGEPLPYETAETFLRSVRSVRSFKPEAVARETLMKLIDIGRYPQTGSNRQGISYLMVETPAKKQALLDAFCQSADLVKDDASYAWLTRFVDNYKQTGHDAIFHGSPQALIALYDKSGPGSPSNAQYSLTFISLIAPSLGVGTCWAGIFQGLAMNDKCNGPIREYLGLSPNQCIGGALMVGYPTHSFKRLVARDPLSVQFI